MNLAMISIAPDVLDHLLALRQTAQESLDDVLRRVLVDHRNHGANDTSSELPRNVPVTDPSSRSVRYALCGEEYRAHDATDALMSILVHLSKGDQRFFEVLAAKVQGRTRNHLARSRFDVYPARSDLAKYVKQVAPGWFLGCNLANREKEKILRAACKVAGLTFGRDLVITLVNA